MTSSQPGLGGFSEVARVLTERFGLDPPLDRRQVHSWNHRRTLNARGRMFPTPVTSDPDAKPRRPRLLFDTGQVIHWFSAGVPNPHNRRGWLYPEDRQT